MNRYYNLLSDMYISCKQLYSDDIYFLRTYRNALASR